MRYRTLGKIARDLGVSVDDVAEIALRFSLSILPSRMLSPGCARSPTSSETPVPSTEAR